MLGRFCYRATGIECRSDVLFNVSDALTPLTWINKAQKPVECPFHIWIGIVSERWNLAGHYIVKKLIAKCIAAVVGGCGDSKIWCVDVHCPGEVRRDCGPMR